MESVVTLPVSSDIDINKSLVNYAVLFFTDKVRDVFVLINFTSLCGGISFVGMVANVINLIVFYRLGLNTTIHISFFSLAVSDLCGLVLQQVFNIFVNPWFVNSATPILFVEVQFLAAAVSREMFTTITCLITVYITAERCMCIVFPLTVKQLVSPRGTTAVMVLIFIATLLSPIPIYCTCCLDWKFYPQRNISLLGLSYRDRFGVSEAAVYFIHAVSGLLSYFAVVIFTAILIYKLKQKSSFYTRANLDQDKTRSLSKRDRTTMTTVVLIATILIVCFIPSGILCVTTFVEPDFNIRGKYYNIFYSLWSFAMLFETINSTIPSVLYLRMSTRYRTQFRLLLFSHFKTHLSHLK